MKTKDIKTYVDYICSKHIETWYAGYRLTTSKSALKELEDNGKTLQDILEILVGGENAPRPRKIGTLEKWLTKGKKTESVVIVKDYQAMSGEDVWLITHFEKFSRRKT